VPSICWSGGISALQKNAAEVEIPAKAIRVRCCHCHIRADSERLGFHAADAHATNRLRKDYHHSCLNSAIYGAPKTDTYLVSGFCHSSKWTAHNVVEFSPLEISSSVKVK